MPNESERNHDQHCRVTYNFRCSFPPTRRHTLTYSIDAPPKASLLPFAVTKTAQAATCNNQNEDEHRDRVSLYE